MSDDPRECSGQDSNIASSTHAAPTVAGSLRGLRVHMFISAVTSLPRAILTFLQRTYVQVDALLTRVGGL